MFFFDIAAVVLPVRSFVSYYTCYTVPVSTWYKYLATRKITHTLKRITEPSSYKTQGGHTNPESRLSKYLVETVETFP